MGSFEGGWLVAGESTEAVDGGPCALSHPTGQAAEHRPARVSSVLGSTEAEEGYVSGGKRGCFPRKSQH